MLPEDNRDAEIAEWLSAVPAPLTFSDLAAQLAARFGGGYEWDAERLRKWWMLHRTGRGRPYQAERDPEILAFVRERIGLQTLDQLRDGLRSAFPGKPVPSRSSLHRFASAERVRLLRREP